MAFDEFIMEKILWQDVEKDKLEVHEDEIEGKLEIDTNTDQSQDDTTQLAFHQR